MPSLKTIRKRIVSIKNTRKITRAIKLVAAAKLRRAQDAILAARPYSQSIARVVFELSAVAGEDAHPLFGRSDSGEAKRVAIVVITADRGLAGAFNTNVIKAVERYAQNELTGATEVTLRIIGKKANQHFARRNAHITSYDPAPAGPTALALARDTANRVVADFLAGKVDRVYLAFNEFKSAGSQLVKVGQLLPVDPRGRSESSLLHLRPEDQAEVAHGQALIDYTYEPNKQVLLDRLVPLYVEIQLYRAMLESIAAFFGIQMMAMENATKNAGDMINRYTLQYNRARQAAITKELLEIISGAEALKG